jgi:hypothetical protein
MAAPTWRIVLTNLDAAPAMVGAMSRITTVVSGTIVQPKPVIASGMA